LIGDLVGPSAARGERAPAPRLSRRTCAVYALGDLVQRKRWALPAFALFGVLRIPSFLEPHWYTDEGGAAAAAKSLLISRYRVVHREQVDTVWLRDDDDVAVSP
jgi:hypothetical protein